MCSTDYAQHEGDHLDMVDQMVQAHVPGINLARRKNSAFSDKDWSEIGCLLACILMLCTTIVFVLLG